MRPDIRSVARSSTRGFTVVELLVVLAAMALLLSIAVPRYLRHVDHAREVALRHNLREMRAALDKFQADKGRPAQTLTELVEARYLAEVPVDPVTGTRDSWRLIRKERPEDERAAVLDVRSGAPGRSGSGEPYGEW